jgi:hypothetical protein
MRRGRIMLLPLLVLALPMAGWAATVFNTGTFNTNCMTTAPLCLIGSVNTSQGLNAGPFSFNLVGHSERFRVLGMTLAAGCSTAAAGICDVTGGTLDVFGSTGLLFTSALVNGQLIKGATSTGATGMEGTAVFTADLVTQPKFCMRCELSVGLTWHNSTLIAGNGRVTGVVPEPGTLGLFATGLFSLAGLARRKLKLPI